MLLDKLKWRNYWDWKHFLAIVVEHSFAQILAFNCRSKNRCICSMYHIIPPIRLQRNCCGLKSGVQAIPTLWWCMVKIISQDYFPMWQKGFKRKEKVGVHMCVRVCVDVCVSIDNFVYWLVSLIEINIPGTELYSLTA